jgi:hypothetical protein
MRTIEPTEDERKIHAERLSQAQSGWLAVAIRDSRRLEQRARWRRLLLARRLSASAGADVA